MWLSREENLNISETRQGGNLHRRFRLIAKSMTLDDHERSLRTLLHKTWIFGAQQENLDEDGSQKCSPWTVVAVSNCRTMASNDSGIVRCPCDSIVLQFNISTPVLFHDLLRPAISQHIIQISLQSSVTIQTRLASVYNTHVPRRNIVDHSHETSTFQHGLEFIMPRYTRIMTNW